MKNVIGFAKTYGPAITAFVLPALAFAQPVAVPPGSGGNTVPGTSITSLQSVLNLLCNIFGWAFWFLIVLAVIFVIVAAFRYLMAGGNPENVGKAGSTLLYAAVAIGVALLARAVPLVVGSFLGAGQVTSC
ncbi:MAG TPA: hypothetical protein VMT99_02980 [Candidatus Paceibacterota bacterium]|nr:hypothetical protein [Candidatus Paceibacterota bacterium]